MGKDKGEESEESYEMVCVGPTTPAGSSSKAKEEPRLVTPIARVRLIEFGGLVSGVTSDVWSPRVDTSLSALQMSRQVLDWRSRHRPKGPSEWR